MLLCKLGSSLTTHVISGIHVLNFLAKTCPSRATLTLMLSFAGQHLTQGQSYLESSPPQAFLMHPTSRNSSHQDDHILSPAPGNSSHHLCVQLPTLPFGETAHTIFASSSHTQGLAICLAHS